uniref:Putative secreted protein n=1 Tax=Panstrongylus lignarius TaxID=156445 RepID=A0A224XR99_9HEMI
MPMTFLSIKTVFTVVKATTCFTFESRPSDRKLIATVACYINMTGRDCFHFRNQASPITLFRKINCYTPSIVTDTCNNTNTVMIYVTPFESRYSN